MTNRIHKAVDVLPAAPHFIECEIQRQLTSRPGLRISSLVVRRVHEGICLQGTVDSLEATRDICAVVQSVEGVSRVMNHLLVAEKP